jgi:hypothetical protein
MMRQWMSCEYPVKHVSGRVRVANYSAIVFGMLFVQSTYASIMETVENPGIQTSTVLNTTVITFDSASTGYHGSQTFSLPGNLTATYSGTSFVYAANQYGGAGGNTNYLAVKDNNPITVTLSASQAYFGMWLSAADPANEIQFYNGDTLLDTFSATGPFLSSLGSAYKGNPNSPFLGYDPSEKFAFVNFFASTSSDKFNKIVLTNIPGKGTIFESDNHAFSTTLQAPSHGTTLQSLSSVPEPSTLVSSLIAVLLVPGYWLLKRKF